VSDDVREYPAWFEILDRVPAGKRLKMVAQVIADIRSYRSKKVKNPEIKYLSDQLENDKEFELVGFTPNFQYMKVEGSDSDRIYHHNFGTPTLVYAHKRLPILVMTNAFIRKDKNVLAENPDNDVDDVRGITG
jgi:hypothetical protein